MSLQIFFAMVKKWRARARASWLFGDGELSCVVFLNRLFKFYDPAGDFKRNDLQVRYSEKPGVKIRGTAESRNGGPEN
jgi:hypothetical protein